MFQVFKQVLNGKYLKITKDGANKKDEERKRERKEEERKRERKEEEKEKKEKREK